MTRYAMVLVATLGTLAGGPASAEETDRYVLERSGDGFVRMDRRTGEMSTCAAEGAKLVCKLAADERTAYQDEIDRLQTDIDGLETRVTRLEGSLAARLESSLPTEKEFNQTMGYMEQFLRRFMDVVKDIDKDEDAVPAPGSAPNRT